jgi:hypothetical protein
MITPIFESIVLNKDDCEALKEYFENPATEKYSKEPHYKNGGLHAIVDLKHIPNDFFKKLEIFNILPFSFNFGVDDSNSLVIHKYKTGEYFEAHSDTSISNYGQGEKLERTLRIKTLLFQLSESDDYAGGDFIVNNKITNRNIGNCICFDSKLIHEVTPIIKGTRYSMSLWVKKENMVLPKKFI